MPAKKGKEKAFVGEHTILSLYWDYEKNEDLDIWNITIGSSRKVWWRHLDADTGIWHEWTARIKLLERSIRKKRKNNSCAICCGYQLQVGANDIKSQFPELMLQWDYSKNTGIDPASLTKGDHLKVWWIHTHKETGTIHSWQASISNRARKENTNKDKGRFCPICHGLLLLRGFNDLQSQNPELAKKWHPTKNGSLRPWQVIQGTERKVWWRHYHKKTKKWHEWVSQVNVMGRDLTGNACGVCSGKWVMIGVNDLLSLRPEIAKQWDYNRNILRPEQVTQRSGKLIYWKHYIRNKKEWHTWRATVGSQIAPGQCPTCHPGGFDSIKESKLYILGDLIKSSHIIQFGISNKIEKRLTTHRKSGFINAPLALIDFPVGSEAMVLERELINLMKEHGLRSCRAQGILFDGSSEAFCLEDADQDFLDEFMELVTR